VPEQPDNIILEKPRMAYPDLKKPPETEIGAVICVPPHKMTTQVDYNCNLQRNSKEAGP
jgi:hypothetical protein